MLLLTCDVFVMRLFKLVCLQPSCLLYFLFNCTNPDLLAVRNDLDRKAAILLPESNQKRHIT